MATCSKNHSYLFCFMDDDEPKTILNVGSFKEALIQLYEYEYGASDIFRLCLKGFYTDAVQKMIMVYNRFASTDISRIFEIKDLVYDFMDKKDEK